MAVISPLVPSHAPRLVSAAPVPSGARRLRLTRRGRLVILLAVLVLGTIGFSLGRASASAPAAPTGPLAGTVVQPGDSLWSVASRVAPHRDPRTEVARIVAVNHLGTDTLMPGQRLLLPR